MVCVEDITGNERYRVCLLCRFEEFMPEVREICRVMKQKQSKQRGVLPPVDDHDPN
jgi:hypothetical protein